MQLSRTALRQIDSRAEESPLSPRPPGLSSVPPGSVAAACTADYACTIFPTKTLSDPAACGVTNRRGIKLCHQILTSNYARTDQLHGGGRFARETIRSLRPTTHGQINCTGAAVLRARHARDLRKTKPPTASPASPAGRRAGVTRKAAPMRVPAWSSKQLREFFKLNRPAALE
jgi:hypothetical protein